MLSNVTRGFSTNESTEVYSLTGFTDGRQPDFRPWDTSDPFFSATTRILMQQVLKCYIRQPVVFVGVLGNVLCCAVFLKEGLSDRIHLLLFWLAVADLGNLLSQLFNMPDCYFCQPRQAANWLVVVNAKVTPINWCLTYTSGLLTLLLSGDRCLSVVVPFKAKRLLKYRLTALAITASYLLPLGFSLFRLMVSTVSWRRDPSTNENVAFIDKAPWSHVHYQFTANLMFSFALVTKPIFLVFMIVSCTITIVYLRRASQERMSMGGNVNKEDRVRNKRITVMLLVICCAYIVLTLPEMGAYFTSQLVPGYTAYKQYHNTVIIHYQFVWVAACVNSALNFFPYLLLSSQFRKSLKSMCSCTKNPHV